MSDEPKYGDWDINEWKKYRAKVASYVERHKASLERVQKSPALQGESWRAGMVRHYENLISEKERELLEVGTIIDNLLSQQGEGAAIR